MKLGTILVKILLLKHDFPDKAFLRLYKLNNTKGWKKYEKIGSEQKYSRCLGFDQFMILARSEQHLRLCRIIWFDTEWPIYARSLSCKCFLTVTMYRKVSRTKFTLSSFLVKWQSPLKNKKGGKKKSKRKGKLFIIIINEFLNIKLNYKPLKYEKFCTILNSSWCDVSESYWEFN